jgi:hypothetical protein
MLVNVSITTRDQYVHLIVFMAAALVLLIRLNLLDQAREWRARGMRDVADVSQAFMRNGAIFVAIAIVAATTLAANASSAPLGRAWKDMDDDLLEVGYAINRFIGGVSGSARGPNILFTPNQTIRGVWESSSVVVFTATSTDDVGHRWRGATYDSFDGNTWQQTDRSPQIVEAGADVLSVTTEPVRGAQGRHIAVVTVTPADYSDDTIVAPDAPAAVNQQVEVQTNGPGGSFISVKLVNGVQQDVPYVVQSFVRDDHGKNELTGNQLAAAGGGLPGMGQESLHRDPAGVNRRARVADGAPDQGPAARGAAGSVSPGGRGPGLAISNRRLRVRDRRARPMQGQPAAGRLLHPEQAGLLRVLRHRDGDAHARARRPGAIRPRLPTGQGSRK